VIFIGHGVTLSEASRELTEFAKKHAIPVISSPNGMGCFDMTEALSLGFIGRNGAFPANEAGRHADLVIAIGARFDDRSASSWMPGYSWNFPTSKLIHVDLDPAEIGRNYPPDLGILADARTFLRQLLAESERRGGKGPNTKAWLAAMAGWKKQWDDFTRPNFGVHASPIRPERVVADCQAVLPDDAILACDVLRHGLRRRRRARRQAGRAGQTGGRDRRRRLLHDGAARIVHGGRIQHPGRLGDLE
jgi:acetolactate synthase-1/2/3 large subunit